MADVAIPAIDALKAAVDDLYDIESRIIALNLVLADDPDHATALFIQGRLHSRIAWRDAARRRVTAAYEDLRRTWVTDHIHFWNRRTDGVDVCRDCGEVAP